MEGKGGTEEGKKNLESSRTNPNGGTQLTPKDKRIMPIKGSKGAVGGEKDLVPI